MIFGSDSRGRSEEIRLFRFRAGLSLFVLHSPHQDFNEDYSDLDGIVQQRRQEMEESSSTGSQTPELECFQGEWDHRAPRGGEWTSSVFLLYPLLMWNLVSPQSWSSTWILRSSSRPQYLHICYYIRLQSRCRQ